MSGCHVSRDDLKQLKKMEKTGIMNQPLRRVVNESIMAIGADKCSLAYDLTSVKALICGFMGPEVKCKFKEDDEKNMALFNTTFYRLLDRIHHDVAFGSDRIPHGMFVGTTDGVLHGGRMPTEKKNPVVKMIDDDFKHSREAAERERRALHRKWKKEGLM
jgi:hypothetical protein